MRSTFPETRVVFWAFFTKVSLVLESVNEEEFPAPAEVGLRFQLTGANSPVKPLTVVLTVAPAASEGAAERRTGTATRAAFKKLLVRDSCVMDGTVVERRRNGGCVGRNLRAHSCYSIMATSEAFYCRIRT